MNSSPIYMIKHKSLLDKPKRPASMSISRSAMLREVLKCPHCTSLLDQPKLIPCGASMCLRCLQSIGFQIDKCPVCGQKHKVNPEHLLEHPDIVRLLENYRFKYDSLTLSKSLATSTHQLYDNMQASRRNDLDKGKVGSGTAGFGEKSCSPDRGRSRSQPPNKLAALFASGLPRNEMQTRLDEYMRKLVERVGHIENGYEQTKGRIEDEIDAIKNEIHTKADLLIDQIIEKRDTMIRDVEMYKNELLVDHYERFVKNDKFIEFKDQTLNDFQQIKQDVENLNTSSSLSSSKDADQLRCLLQRIEMLNAKINNHQRLLPEADLKVGLTFKANNWPDIKVPLLGDISYDSIYKIDIKSKIESFNNDYQHLTFEFGALIDQNPVSKNIGIISKNKFLVLYEKIYGKVKTTFVKIVYYDMSVLAELEIQNVGNFVTYLIYDKYILLAFRHSKKHCMLHLYDVNLKKLKENTYDVDYNISYLLMNQDYVYVIAEKKPFINEYDLELNFRDSFGQMNHKDKPFYVREEIIAVTAEKIFVKDESVIRLVCRTTGTQLFVVDKIDDLKTSTVFLDYNKEKYIVFNGYDKIVYYNHKGDVIATNKLRNYDILKEKIDEFQFSRSGHFAFISYATCKVVVI